MADSMQHPAAEADATAERFVLARRGLVWHGRPLASARAAWLPAQVRVVVATVLPHAPAAAPWPPDADEAVDEADSADRPQAAPTGELASSPSPRAASAPGAARAAAALVLAAPTRTADVLLDDRVHAAHSADPGAGSEADADAGAGNEAVARQGPVRRTTEAERVAAPSSGAVAAASPASSRRPPRSERDVRESVTRPSPAALPAALRPSPSQGTSAGSRASVPGNNVARAQAASATAEVSADGTALAAEQAEPQHASPAARSVESVARPGSPGATMGRFDTLASASPSLRLPPSDLSVLLSPPRPQRIVRIDRLDIGSAAPALQAPPAAAMPAAAPAERPTAATPRPYRNPWSGYHARRD